MLYRKLIRRAASSLLAGSLLFIQCDAADSIRPENIIAAESHMENEWENMETEELPIFDTEQTETSVTEETGVTETEETTESIQTETVQEMESSEKVSEDEEESETLTETESCWTELEESEGETGTEFEMEEEEIMEVEENADIDITFAKIDLPPSGRPVVGAPGWQAASMTDGFSADFFPVRFYSGISSLQAFNNSSSVVVSDYGGRPTFYPTKRGQGGKFGVIYKKVLYDGNRWYDLKITVVDYTTSVRSDGGDMQKSYPYVGFTTESIGWKFNTVLGATVMKCEFLDTLTGAPGKLNTRFQWWDIDAAQRFGLRLIDGNVNGRYYNAAGSTVYCESNTSIAGVSGMETVVGPVENAAGTDPAYCVAFELAGCSAYYMGIGIRDHIEYDENSYGKNTLERLNSELASGIYSGMVEELNQTDTSFSKIHTPAPVKSVSNDGKVWEEKNTLADINGTYLYQLRQFVPWQNSSAYYESFVIKDVLPVGADYADSLQIIREEDGADVTGWFTVSADKNVVMVTANSTVREASSFYGYHYCIRFTVKMNTEQLEPVYNGNRAEYTLKNKAECIVKHSMDSSYITENSNTVTTLAAIERKEASDPQKGFDEERDKDLKILNLENESITYSIFQDVPEYDKAFLPARIEVADKLEECLQFDDIEVKLKKAGSMQWETLEGWERKISGQNIEICREYADEYNGGTFMFNITCHIRKNFDLSPWGTIKGEDDVWTVIPNKAAITFEWRKGEPLRVSRESNVATVKLRNTHIRLSKEIDTSDIVWEHGNPTFTFKVEGTDLDGNKHTYYQTKIFEPGNIGYGKKALLTADFDVPAGVYIASEEKTIRYRLEQIYDVVGGMVIGNTVKFDLTKGQDGAAVFYNVKVTDEDESHTAFVKNHIGN